MGDKELRQVDPGPPSIEPAKPPLVLIEHGDVTTWPSTEDVVAYVEAIDVENDEYEVFGTDGQVVQLAVVNGVVVGRPTASSEPERLQWWLANFVDSVGAARFGLSQAEVTHGDLAQLVEAVDRFARA